MALPGEVAADAEEAAAEVARFDAELGREIAPFAAVLLRTESAASSKIENLTASARAIAEAEIGPTRSRNAALIVANERAMTAAIALADRMDGEAILALHEALLGHSDPDITGRWREDQVWIGGHDLGPHQALFVPPHPEHVPAAIDDLVAFIDRDDVPVLAHAALAHAKFETIHPFPDGNGRVGRALVHAHLRKQGLDVAAIADGRRLAEDLVRSARSCRSDRAPGRGGVADRRPAAAPPGGDCRRHRGGDRHRSAEHLPLPRAPA